MPDIGAGTLRGHVALDRENNLFEMGFSDPDEFILEHPKIQREVDPLARKMVPPLESGRIQDLEFFNTYPRKKKEKCACL